MVLSGNFVVPGNDLDVEKKGFVLSKERIDQLTQVV
jgi:hypothetical protein